MNKVPLGVMPKKFWIKTRSDELKRAICEYMEAGFIGNNIIKWTKELVELNPPKSKSGNSQNVNQQTNNAILLLEECYKMLESCTCEAPSEAPSYGVAQNLRLKINDFLFTKRH